MSDGVKNPRRVIRNLNIAGFALRALMVGGFGGWAATTQLAGAVIAPGVVVVQSSVKKVQHPTGGVVGELLGKEGGPVEAGQIVIRLDGRGWLGTSQGDSDENDNHAVNACIANSVWKP
jgi:HlyD family secretion protein